MAYGSAEVACSSSSSVSLTLARCFSQRLQAAPLPADLPLPLLPLCERSLRLLPALAGPRRIDQLDPEKQLALPSGLAQHVLGSQHKARIVRQGDLGHGG